MNMDPPDRRKVTVFAESENFVVAQAPNGFLRVYNKDNKEQVFFASIRKRFPKENLQRLAEWFQQGKGEGEESFIEVLKVLV